MISKNTTAKILYHAGLCSDLKFDVPSLDEVLLRGGPFEESVCDLLETLQALNSEVNGEVPSESLGADESFPRSVVYGLSEVIRQLRNAAFRSESPSIQSALSKAATRVELGWAAVLSGDVDDLIQHIDEELEFGDR